jgi:hypothetical protein
MPNPLKCIFCGKRIKVKVTIIEEEGGDKMEYSHEDDIEHLQDIAEATDNDEHTRHLNRIAHRLNVLQDFKQSHQKAQSVLGHPGTDALEEITGKQEATLANIADYHLKLLRQTQWLSNRRRIFIEKLHDRIVKPHLFNEEPEETARQVMDEHAEARTLLREHHPEPWKNVLDWMSEALLCLDDLGACNNPDCEECPRVLPRGITLYNQITIDQEAPLDA